MGTSEPPTTEPRIPLPSYLQVYEPGERILTQLDLAFTYHPPATRSAADSQVVRYTAIRSAAHAIANILVRATPPSREQSLALTKLEEAVMWANAAIARHESGLPGASGATKES